MKILYFDCFAGASGDMILGALADLGVPLEVLAAPLHTLGLDQVSLRAEQVHKRAIGATSVFVELADEPHEHPHSHTHGHTHEDTHNHQPPHQHSHGKSYAEIKQLLESADLAARVKELSLRIFERIAKAEAKMHGTSMEEVHFHELGGYDSIADIVGAAAGFAWLGVDEFVSSPLPTFSGTVETQHGTLPLPAPATLLLMQGVPLRSTDFEVELVTPTGAGIISALCTRYGPLPSLVLEATGFGAGKRELAVANVLRLVVGVTGEAPLGLEIRNLEVLETEIDNMNPELYEPVFEKLFALGALDVYTTPVFMKKQRHGLLLTVLCPPEVTDRATEIILRETTTLGLRVLPVERRCLQRDFISVATPYGEVKCKVGRLKGEAVHSSPEYEDCKRLAAESQVSVLQVWEAALTASKKML